MPTPDTQLTRSLRVAEPGRVDMKRATEVLTNLDWLGPGVDGPARDRGVRRVRTDLALPIFDHSGAGPILKAALVDLGLPERRRGLLLVEIGWQSASLAPLFPVFAGRLVVSQTGLVLDGRYVPPFGQIGLLIDAGILHLVARRTAEAFLARLAAQFEE